MGWVKVKKKSGIVAALAMASLIVALSCRSITAPPVGASLDASSYAPLEAEVLACAGQSRGPAANWHVVPDGALGAHVVAEWYQPDEIYLTEFVVSHRVEVTIKHEYLHAILQTAVHGPLFYECGLMIDGEE
jgi:hypothetical protein